MLAIISHILVTNGMSGLIKNISKSRPAKSTRMGTSILSLQYEYLLMYGCHFSDCGWPMVVGAILMHGMGGSCIVCP